MSLETEIQRGERAAHLLNDELLQEAFATIEKEYTEKWLNSPVRDNEGREHLFLMVKTLHRLRSELLIVLETGQVARATLAERLGETFKRHF
jgi:hypothetical protein